MNAQLFTRSLGIVGPESLIQWRTAQLLESLAANPAIRFDAEQRKPTSIQGSAESEAGHQAALLARHRRDDPYPRVYAHRAGVNALAIDPFEGR